MGELDTSADEVCSVCGATFRIPDSLRAAGLVFCPTCGGSVAESATAAPVPAIALGTTLGKYRLLELVGEGGMGRVYVAEHITLGRRVAIKMLRGELAASPNAVSRFFAEARAVNRICHENIVEVTDFIENPGGHNCYVMELLRGESLGRRLGREGALPVHVALEIAAQIASALSAVHAGSIVHRDLKPDNIFLIDHAGHPNFVKLLDFGVAKLGDVSGAVSTHSTMQGQIIGTPDYMSPEQADGRVVDRRTDIYSLGVIIYEMVTGRLPFSAATFGELVIKHMTVPPVAPSKQPGLVHDIPHAVDELVLELLAKSPDDRPHSMTDVGVRIHDMLDEMDVPMLPRHAMTSGPIRIARAESAPIRRPTPVIEPKADTLLAAGSQDSARAASSPSLPRARRRRWPIAAAIGGGVALAGIVAWTVFGGSSEPATPGSAAVVETPRTPPPAPMVTVRFSSTPPGAEVRLVGESRLLGTTPFAIRLPRVDRVATFELSKQGYAPVTEDLALGGDGSVAAALNALPAKPEPAKPEPAKVDASKTTVHRPKPKPAKPATTPVDRGGTIDVFGGH